MDYDTVASSDFLETNVPDLREMPLDGIRKIRSALEMAAPDLLKQADAQTTNLSTGRPGCTD